MPYKNCDKGWFGFVELFLRLRDNDSVAISQKIVHASLKHAAKDVAVWRSATVLARTATRKTVARHRARHIKNKLQVN